VTVQKRDARLLVKHPYYTNYGPMVVSVIAWLRQLCPKCSS
jgi:hypothetical protein